MLKITITVYRTVAIFTTRGRQYLLFVKNVFVFKYQLNFSVSQGGMT